MLSSACVNEAGGGRAIGVSVGTSPGVHASVLRNSTFVATGPGSVAMDFGYFAGADGVIGAVNAIGVIARGVEKDVIARGKELSGGKGAATNIQLQASDYATTGIETSGSGSASVTPIETNGNITAPPLLAEDNVHQLSGSPTIDKGAVDEASDSLDIDGQAREIGLAPDIGADELGNPTTTSVSCQPQTFAPGGSATCSVVVEDTGTALTQPTGEVTLAPVTGLTVPASCTLVPDKEASSRCAVTVSGGTVGDFTVVAHFDGDSGHEASEGSGKVAVSKSSSEGPPPNTKLRKHPPKRTTKRLAKFTFTFSQAGSRFEYKLDRKPYRSCHSPFKRKLKPGRHVFRVRAVKAGRRDPTPARFAWKIVRKAS